MNWLNSFKNKIVLFVIFLILQIGFWAALFLTYPEKSGILVPRTLFWPGCQLLMFASDMSDIFSNWHKGHNLIGLSYQQNPLFRLIWAMQKKLILISGFFFEWRSLNFAKVNAFHGNFYWEPFPFSFVSKVDIDAPLETQGHFPGAFLLTQRTALGSTRMILIVMLICYFFLNLEAGDQFPAICRGCILLAGSAC